MTIQQSMLCRFHRINNKYYMSFYDDEENEIINEQLDPNMEIGTLHAELLAKNLVAHRIENLYPVEDGEWFSMRDMPKSPTEQISEMIKEMNKRKTLPQLKKEHGDQ